MVKFGKQIKKYRELAGLSQMHLAEKCGWLNDEGRGQQSLVGNYEREIREPSLERLDKIASVLGVTLVQLLDDKPKKAKASDEELMVKFKNLKPTDQKIMLDLAKRLSL